MDVRKFNYTRVGSGAPVLLVNGSYQRRVAWKPIAKALASNFEVITFDFPNQSVDFNGGTAEPTFDRPEMYEDYLLAFLESLSLDPKDVTACGMSFGCSLLKSLHLRRGVDFKRLVLMGLDSPDLAGFYEQYNRAAREILETYGIEWYVSFMIFWYFSHNWFNENPKIRELVASQYKVMFAASGSMEALFRAHVADQERGFPTGRVRCPTFALNGVDDAINPPKYVKRYAESIGATFRCAEGGHVFTVEAPEAAAALLCKILE